MQKPYYQDRDVTLFLGDNREILPQLDRETFDLAVTDPPYLVSYTGRWGKKLKPIEGDSESDWVLPTYSEVFRLLQPNSLCLTFFGWPHTDVFLRAWRTAGFRPVSICALVKSRIGLGYFTRSQHELAYILAKGKPQKPARAPSDVLKWPCSRNVYHPNQKPVSVMAKLIAPYARPQCTILDPFCGSGTTLLAAKVCNSKAVGIEIDERFCEIAATRLSQRDLDFQDVCSGPRTPAQPALL